MKKINLFLSLSVLSLFYGRYEPSVHLRVQNGYLPLSNMIPKITSYREELLLQEQKVEITQMNFIHLQKALGKIDVGFYAIESNTPIVLIETLSHNINVKGYHKMIDNFSSLYSSDNKVLMRAYQSYADQNCQKIYGCVGSDANDTYDWKIIKFLPNPENVIYNPPL